MSISRRLIASASALLGATVLLAGCATAGDSGPTEGDGSGGDAPVETTDDFEVDAAWLDDGRMVAVVTWGSSSCIPLAEEVTAEGQTVSITLSEGEADQPCTADLTTRATLVGLPEGVDPTEDVELVVTLGATTGEVELDGNDALVGVPGEATDYRPTAGWYDGGGLVLLTWGSSSCQPVVDSVDLDGNTGTVTFATEDGPCTMDMAPRATLIEFDEIGDDTSDAFTLVLVGDNLDATLDVIDS